MKRYILGVVMAVVILVGGPAGHVLAADPTAAAKSQVCSGLNDQTGGSCGSASGVSLTRVIRGAVTLLSAVAGVAAVIMIIVSGLKYITSAGEAQAVAGAKRALIYAVVGLVVVAMAQTIVYFVLHQKR